jgi:hypothetical protein
MDLSADSTLDLPIIECFNWLFVEDPSHAVEVDKIQFSILHQGLATRLMAIQDETEREH